MGKDYEVIQPGLFAGTVSDEIVATVNDVVSEKGRCVMVLCGGSTPGAVYRSLATPPRVGEIPWKQVIFILGDERWVPADDPRSNRKMVVGTLLDHRETKGARFIPYDTSCGSPQESIGHFEEALRTEVNDLSFDLVLSGIGEDCHIASLFPHSSLLAGKVSRDSVAPLDPLCGVTEHPHDGTTRISLLPSVLDNAERTFVLINGRGKSEAIKRIFSEPTPPLLDCPASLYVTARHPVTWFLDSHAAVLLK
jgi:6-phosphogluconolactonase